MEEIHYQIIIAIVTLFSAWGIAHYQICEGRKLNTENLKTNERNAGKNRAIYAIEQMDIARDDRSFNDNLNKMLNSGDYTILTAFVNAGNTTQTRYILGKIKP